MNPEYLDANKDLVSKLFRAYGLYNLMNYNYNEGGMMFQSSFELTGYIT